MANRKFLSSVYPNLNSSGDVTKLNPHVRASDCSVIVSVTGDTHSLSHICQLAIKTAADYVRTNKLDFTSQDKLAEFLRERSVVTPPTTEAVAPHVSGRASGGGEQVADVAHGKSVPRTRVEAGRSGKEGKGGKGVGGKAKVNGKLG